MSFISFSCLTALGRTSSSTLSKSSNSRHFALLTITGESSWSFIINCNVGCFVEAHYQVEIPLFLVFSFCIMTGCWICQMFFSVINWYDHFFSLLIRCITLIFKYQMSLASLEQTLLSCLILFMDCCIVSYYFVKDLYVYFLRDISLQFSFMNCLWFWYQDKTTFMNKWLDLCI